MIHRLRTRIRVYYLSARYWRASKKYPGIAMTLKGIRRFIREQH